GCPLALRRSAAVVLDGNLRNSVCVAGQSYKFGRCEMSITNFKALLTGSDGQTIAMHSLSLDLLGNANCREIA
ncbi:MAG: hypothetical protein ACPIOQ_20985, partial [Promethearchaeia archaeon]